MSKNTQRTDFWLPRGKAAWEMGGLGVRDQQMQTIMQRIDKQQGPIVQHMKRYSMP